MRDFEYIDSLTCYGHHSNGEFQRMVQSRREVWFGGDGSGLLRTHFIKSLFFSTEQQARWQAQHGSAPSGANVPSDMLFAPHCWNGPRARLVSIARDAARAEPIRVDRELTLANMKALIGEALVPASLRRRLFDLCAGLSGAEVNDEARDQIDRPGISVARDEHDRREELIYDAQTYELIGTRQVLLDPRAGYAPEGATVGWSCFMARKLHPATG